MPVYRYECAGCGGFEDARAMSEYDRPVPCPACGEAAPRALTVPAYAAMDGGRRTAAATNERSAHAPASTRTHGAGCACCRAPGLRRADGLKSFGGARPWMISH